MALLAADRLLASGDYAFLDDLFDETGDVEFDAFDAALDGLVAAGLADREFREGERGPIGGWAWREGDYLTPLSGLEKTARKALIAWRKSARHDAGIEALLFHLAGSPRPVHATPVPEPIERDPVEVRLEALIDANDAAGLLGAVRGLEVSLQAKDESDLYRFSNHVRSTLAGDPPRRALQEALALGAQPFAAAQCAVDLPREEARRLLGDRARTLFEMMLGEVAALRPDAPAIYSFLQDGLAALNALAELQADPNAAFDTIRETVTAWRGTEMEDVLYENGPTGTMDVLGDLDRAQGEYTQRVVGPVGAIAQLESGASLAFDQRKLVEDVLRLGDREVSARLARLSPRIAPGYLRDLLPELVRRGWHDAVDGAVVAHEDALYWMIEELLAAGYVPGTSATAALRSRAASWPHSVVHRDWRRSSESAAVRSRSARSRGDEGTPAGRPASSFEGYSVSWSERLDLPVMRTSRLLWTRRSAMATAAAELWKSLPQSLNGRFVVTMVEPR